MNNKKTFILLMGPDGSGKTTIGTLLSDFLGFKLQHFGPPKSYEEGKKQYFDFIKDTDTHVICDRFHEGEKIFAPLYRGYSADYFEELEKALMEKFNVLLVLMYAPYEVIEKRLIEKGEDFVKPEHFKYTYDKVVDLFNESKLPKMIVDTHHFSVDTNLRTIIHHMLKRGFTV